MSFGLDYVTGPPIADLKSAGVAFVCRYLSEVNPATQIKLLTPTEAKLLGENDMAIVSNYEWTGTTALGGYDAGVFDAQIAQGQHTACGGPADRPIYFSVDFDASTAQMGAISEYFKGVASVIGLARTGVYGSYAVVKYLLDNDLVTWAWQTYAWSDGAWDSRAQLQQYQNGVQLGGHSVDYDRSTVSDFGQWIPGGVTMVPTGWTDANGTLTAPNKTTVVLGFRQHILDAPAWDGGNVPLEAEYHAAQVLLHNPGIGAGQVQVFRDGMLWYTPVQGVVQEPYLGLEIQAAYDEITALQAEIAQLKAVPPTPVDTSALVASIHAIADGVVPLVAAALVQAAKV